MRKRIVYKRIIAFVCAMVLIFSAMNLSPSIFSKAEDVDEEVASEEVVETDVDAQILDEDGNIVDPSEEPSEELSEEGLEEDVTEENIDGILVDPSTMSEDDIDALLEMISGMSDEELEEFFEENPLVMEFIYGLFESVDGPMLFSYNGEPNWAAYTTTVTGSAGQYGDGINNFHEFSMADGNTAFCIEHNYSSGFLTGSATEKQFYVYTGFGNATVKKLVYYSHYCGNDWEVYNQIGISEEAYRVATHMMISYALNGVHIAPDATANSRNGTSVSLNNYYRSIYDYVMSLPDPPSSIGFSATDFKPSVATVDGESVQKTKDITVNANSSASFNLTLNSGMKLYFVNKSGDTAAHTGSVTLHGKDKFYLTAPASADFKFSPTVSYTGYDNPSFYIYVNRYHDEGFQSAMAVVPGVLSGSFEVQFKPTDAYVQVKKTSKNPAITSGNPCYNFNGAQFKVYATRGLADSNGASLGTLTADASGNTTALKITAPSSGYVYVKETVAPKGYKLDTTVYPVAVTTANTSANPAVVTISDEPGTDPMLIVVKKVRKNPDGTITNIAVPNAKFTVKYYMNETASGTAARTWYFVSDSNGEVRYDSAWLDSSKSSDAFYLSAATSAPTLPYGSITVEETEAPEGFIRDTAVHTYVINETTTALPQDNRLNPADPNSQVVVNVIESEPFKIQKFGDTVEPGTLEPLSGAGFVAINVENLTPNASGNYVWNEAAWNANPVKVATDGSTVLYTDANGDATSARLPRGTYLIHEKYVPDGFKQVPDFIFVSDEDKAVPGASETFTRVDESIKVYIRIHKNDADTNKPIIRDTATFKVWSYDENKYVSFRVIEGGAPKYVSEFTTVDGKVMLPGLLTYGDYRLDEIEQPEGYYNHDDSLPADVIASLDFAITDGMYTNYVEDGVITDLYVQDVVMPNKAIYAQFELQKDAEQRRFDEDTKEWKVVELPLENIDFEIYAKENILSADGDGTIEYAADTLVTTITTDATGHAISPELLPGVYYMVEKGQPEDYVPMDDIEVVLNDDADLIDVTNPDGSVRKMYYKVVNVLNKTWVPTIETTATDVVTGTHTGKIGETTTIEDKVAYECLIPGRTYKLYARPYIQSTGEQLKDKDGNPIVEEKEFTPTSASGVETISVTFDSSLLQGECITMFERVYHDDILVAFHEQIDSQPQTVVFLDGKTQARDMRTEDHIGTVTKRGETETVIDTVAVNNAIVGEAYEIKAVLYNKATGLPFLINGKEITKTVSYVAEKKNDTIDISIDVDTSYLAGETVVFYESIYTNGIEVFAMNDLSDAEETLWFPEVKTTALDKKTDDHYGSSADETIIEVDTVYARNLQIGKSYEVKGVLMDAGTNQPILNNGEKITASKTFVADAKDMEIKIEFSCPASLIQGVTTVCFEDLYHNDKLVYSHSDITDKNQQVSYPGVKTTAVAIGSGSHYGVREKEFEMSDLVEYVNMKPNTKFVCKGMIMDYSTGMPLMIDDEMVTSEISFSTTDSKNGSISVPYKFDATVFDKKDATIVCYEWIYEVKEDGTLELVAKHTDLKDSNQQIQFPRYPKTGDNSPLGKAKVIFLFALCGVVTMGTVLVVGKKRRNR